MDYIKEVKSSGLKVIDLFNYFGLLEHETLAFKEHGAQIQGNCPFPHHPGDRNSRGFGLHTAKDVYICSTHCGEGQGVIDFWCDMKGWNRNDGRNALAAAREIYHTFIHNNSFKQLKAKRSISVQSHLSSNNPGVKKVNEPKNIRLTLNQPPPDFLQAKSLKSQTIASFDAGIAQVGSMKGRFTVAVHNKKGQKLGYAGQNLQNGEWYFFFNKGIELYNYHRVVKLSNIRYIIVVESFYSAMYLTQCGYPNVVSGFGRFLTETQLQLISELSNNVLLFFDNDEPGRKATSLFMNKYKGKLNVKVFDYQNQAQKPYLLTQSYLRQHLPS